ncbi:uncharacterized protein LOC117786863 [Drosophila innubila]|uniref:uncharacterized protein LOC117786863 n=1 Tax=Drosophila innubila TaxID=198719 RepID=UPI00148BC06B|nr:uncharacterized protein LOC117786863 [Drosophila innubila]
MSWSVDFDNRLIELVRANPSLYERELRSTPYDSGKKKRELWCSIATSLKTDVKTCITRWNYMRDKLRRELLKDQSDWSLLEKLRFVGQHKVNSNRNNERQLQQAVTTSALINVSWRALSPDQLIAQDEDDALQEAMDEQHVASAVIVPPPPLATPVAGVSGSGTSASNEDLMKRIEALLQGLGTNRSKAEKKIVAYLCKCTLRALNDEQIDDIFI